MSLCLVVAGKSAALGASLFTLAWTHSVERTRWEEDWVLTPRGLVIAEARVQGSGAGMEPPEGARFDGTWWRYTPDLPALPELRLAASGHAGAWDIRTPARTWELRGADSALIKACPPQPPASGSTPGGARGAE